MTLTSISASAAPGPVFYDRVSFPGPTSNPTGGTTGLAAALKALRKDSRSIISAQPYGPPPAVGYSVAYDPATDKLSIFFENQTSGVVAEAADADYHTTLATIEMFIVSV